MWKVTVPLWRSGQPVPIPERIEQLETFKKLVGSYAVDFEDQAAAEQAAFTWSQALGFSVEAKRKLSLPPGEI
jgi:hypothetical protein